MGCGGCGKRKRALKKKINEALRKIEEAEKKDQDIPADAKKIIDQNKTMAYIMKRDSFVAQKKKLLQEKKDIPFELEKSIEEQSKLINESIHQTRSRRILKKTSQQEIIDKIVKEKQTDFVPEEFKNLVKAPIFDSLKKYDILTDPINGRYKRSILRNERVFRRRLTTAIEMGDQKGMFSLSKEYSQALFNLFLLLKREMSESIDKVS